MMYSRGAFTAVPLVLSLIVGPAAWAQVEEQDTAEPAPRQSKQQAKEDRIAEYLQKREEKRIVRERQQAQREAEATAQALELEHQQLMEQAQAASAGAAAAAAAPQGAPPKGFSAGLPKDLAEAQAAIRLTSVAQDPTVSVYLDLIDRSMASPQQLAAFANFIADNGMNRLALIYYDVAIRLDKTDQTMWVNVGTLHRQLGNWDKAKSAFAKALSINPANAVAHYNLAVIYDNQGKYKQAIEEYRIALTLDPTLGDPAYNPSAANNDRLLAVKMLIYQEQAGNIGLPLIDVSGGDVDGITPLSPQAGLAE